MTTVLIRKLDHAGRELISYPGTALERRDGAIVLETSWDREPLDLGFVVLEPDDRWMEFFYPDRWYNVFRIEAKDGHVKGWYCNITRPARISEHEVAAEDLALDLWVGPDGETTVLDEDEFAELSLCSGERIRARKALAELKRKAAMKEPPFDNRDGA